MRATMKHVAARAGVSIKTVSNVVNGSERVAKETRQRVQAAIDELDFVPNATARSLRSGRSGVVALALPELHAPYFAELAQHVVETAGARGWTVLVDSTGGRLKQERLAVSGIRPQLIDGLIFSPLALRASDLPDAASGPPTVLLGERVTDAAVDLVTVDNHAVAAAAVEHLAGLGRRRIAAVGAQTTEAGVTARLRLEGYRQGLARAGLPRDDGLVLHAPVWHRAEGAAAARALLDAVDDVDAIVCFNDLLALGVLRCLADAGVRVPDDIAVVGVDDVEDGRYSSPSLTTVALDKAQIARTAVELLAARLEGAQDAPPRVVVAAHRLVVRESTTGVRAATPGPMTADPLRVQRLPERQRFDRAALDDVLDAALVAHVALVRDDGTPVVLPLLAGRDGDRLLLHGSTGGGLLRAVAAGAPVAVAVTVVDGLVYARSMFESSANYRSAVVFGRCRPVTGQAKVEALRVLAERLMPGRWEEVRAVTPKELAATLVLELPLDEASVKVRSGPPSEEEGEPREDDWWGVLPLATVAGVPEPAPGVRPGTPPPASVARFSGGC